jgi:hypothetical protein
MTRIRTYSELCQLSTFQERYLYLALRGEVGESTFGSERFLNQAFYRSHEWQNLRHQIIVRDQGCDLGIIGHEINDRLYIHHMNPMTVVNVRERDASILDPQFLITTTHDTHNAIHYGDPNLLAHRYVERRAGDTKLW